MKTSDQDRAGDDSGGLMIWLNSEQCKNLGVVHPLRAGTPVKLSALAVVDSSTERMGDKDGDEGRGRENSMTLLITDMELTAQQDLKGAASKLYGANEA